MIVKSIMLRCEPQRAFTLFTERAGDWWPSERRHTDDDASTIRIEPDGPFFERAADGTEVQLGRVRAFAPPHRLALDWFPGTGPEHPTFVEVEFEPVDGGTRVTVSHAAGTAPQATYDENAGGYDRSWDLVLNALAVTDAVSLRNEDG
jgi:uncharacterized protein YndB with AHSA1/START domain